MYIEEHQGRDPATVWLHHGVGSTRSWDRFLPAGAGGRRAVVYDRDGFGRSRHGRKLTTALFDEDVADLEVMLTERGGEPVHLIGHSDGGTVALLLAARAPALVLSIALVSVHVRGDATTVATLRRMGPPDQWPEPMRRSLRRDHGDDWLEVASAWYALWTSSAWERWSIVDELPAVACPVFAMHALRDDLAPRLHVDTIRDALPASRITWVETSAHDPHRVQPERFAADLESLWCDAEHRDG